MYCSRIISICMFRVPSFGDEVISVLWDSNVPIPSASPGTPTTPRILLTHDYAGSTCSLFGGSSLHLPSDVSADLRSVPSDRAAPATLEDLKAVEGDYNDSKFRVTEDWLNSVMHTCKLHPLVDREAERRA